MQKNQNFKSFAIEMAILSIVWWKKDVGSLGVMQPLVGYNFIPWVGMK